MRSELKDNKLIFNIYVAYKKYMSIMLTKLSPIIATKYVYRYNTGKKLNLTNPHTFNEKLQWIKVYGDKNFMVQCADKFAVRKYVEECGCNEILNELYGCYNSVDEIDFNTLPRSFVMKTTNGCGTNFICRDKSKIDVRSVKKQLRYWMKHKYGLTTAEFHYLAITPRIICEKIIETEDGDLPFDYKFFCFNGEPKFFYLGYDREHEFKKVHYDLKWNVIDITKEKPVRPKVVRVPKCFDEMVNYAKRISKDIPFVRVDFYDSKGKVVFGEMTFTPTAGMSDIYTEEAANCMGELIKLPI